MNAGLLRSAFFGVDAVGRNGDRLGGRVVGSGVLVGLETADSHRRGAPDQQRCDQWTQAQHETDNQDHGELPPVPFLEPGPDQARGATDDRPDLAAALRRAGRRAFCGGANHARLVFRGAQALRAKPASTSRGGRFLGRDGGASGSGPTARFGGARPMSAEARAGHHRAPRRLWGVSH